MRSHLCSHDQVKYEPLFCPLLNSKRGNGVHTTSTRPRNEPQVGSPALEVWVKKKSLVGDSVDFLPSSSANGCSPRDPTFDHRASLLYTQAHCPVSLDMLADYVGPVGKAQRNLFKNTARTREMPRCWMSGLAYCMPCIPFPVSAPPLGKEREGKVGKRRRGVDHNHPGVQEDRDMMGHGHWRGGWITIILKYRKTGTWTLEAEPDHRQILETGLLPHEALISRVLSLGHTTGAQGEDCLYRTVSVPHLPFSAGITVCRSR